MAKYNTLLDIATQVEILNLPIHLTYFQLRARDSSIRFVHPSVGWSVGHVKEPERRIEPQAWDWALKLGFVSWGREDGEGGEQEGENLLIL